MSVVGLNAPVIADPVGVSDHPDSEYPGLDIPVASGRVSPDEEVVYVAAPFVALPDAPFVL